MKLIAEKACSLLEERVGLKYMHPSIWCSECETVYLR